MFPTKLHHYFWTLKGVLAKKSDITIFNHRFFLMHSFKVNNFHDILYLFYFKCDLLDARCLCFCCFCLVPSSKDTKNRRLTTRSRISSNPHWIFFNISLYPVSFFVNTSFKLHKIIQHFYHLVKSVELPDVCVWKSFFLS